jgi:hypothetical protein
MKPTKNQYLTNNFEKGLNLDLNINTNIPGVYTYALNAVNKDSDQIGVFSNENSNRYFCDMGSEVIGHVYLDERESFLVFTRDGLYLVDNEGNKEFIVNDDEFNCDWNLDTCEFIIPEVKTISPCNETMVYWSSGCEYFKVNIDEMLNPERKQGLKDSMKAEKNQCSDITCEYFKVFKLSCAPKLAPIAYQTGGGGLKCGAYQFAVRLKNNEGGETNWFTITDPVYIGSEHNLAGENSNGYIEINISGLDCNYDFGELAVISTIGGFKIAKLVTRFNYTNGNYSYAYYGLEGDVIAIDEIIAKGKTYLQGKDLVQYNGNMFYFNIRQQKNINYQPKANQIVSKWRRYRVPVEIAKKYNLKSFLRGETYGFGIKWNSSDGRSTRVFHIPATQGGGDSGNSASIPVPTDTIPTDDINVEQEVNYLRQRTPVDDTVRNPQLDSVTDSVSTIVDSVVTQVTDACEILTNCEDCPEAGSDCDTDLPKVDEFGGVIGGVISGLASPNDLTPDTLGSIKEAGETILDSVENRERTVYQREKITVSKNGTIVSMNSGETIRGGSSLAGLYFDVNGDPEIEFQLDVVNLGLTIPRLEKDILYPDTKDCEGNYIYDDLANKRVRHHQVPWAEEVKHYASNSVGVPSKLTPDADEYKDGYVDIIGPEFSNIQWPTEEELGFKICENNPYTILQIPRTSKNKSIHSKGILTGTIRSTNGGKAYLYPTHGLNSEDSIVNRYIDIDGNRIDLEAEFQQDFNYWSLDTMVKAHALNVTAIKIEGIVSGIGYRHGLYEEGRKPTDSFYGSQIDQRGARQAINLSKFIPHNGYEELRYKIYAPANEVVSPPFGAPCPLMNKYQQESIWLGADFPVLKDRSFKGDVLTHSAPISDAQAYYVALVRELDNQYGDLTNMVYTPILEAGAFNDSRIEGICGDTFIGPHTFVRTSYVSDRVGDYFTIGQMVFGKVNRCVCDSPLDAVHSYNGQWVPTTLPKTGDKSDAKNWAGLHSTDVLTKTWNEANAATPISHYYYPKTVKTLITYWGEFEVNPYMRQTGDGLHEQVYKYISAEYGLDSSVESNSGSGWDKDYLNQFYHEVEQPSKWKIVRKTLIRTILATLAPMFGIDYLIDGSTPVEFVESLGTFGFITGLWFQMLKVTFSNKHIDELLGIPECRTDEEGGENDNYIRNFFTNYNKYNSDLSIGNKLEPFYGLPVPYYTCDCDDCDSTTTDEIYISDEQLQGSQIDAYSVVRPMNVIHLPASKGKLTDIFISGMNLYAHTTEQIIPLRYGAVSQPTSLGDVIIGTGPILDKPTGYSEGIYEGFGGLDSRQHAINTGYGRFFIDYKARKFYLFNSQGFKELSKDGAYNFFKKKLPYCESSDCENEHLSGNDIAIGIDPKLDRILLTKRGQGDDQWTLSYDVMSNNWVSFHSYIPKFYMWDRARMFTCDGTKFWVHDVDCNYQTFMGKFYPHILEFRINDGDVLQDVFKSGLIHTIASTCAGSSSINLHDRDVTFNKLWARNNYQTTGYYELVPSSPRSPLHENITHKASDKPYVVVDKANGYWKYNELKDRVDNINSPMYIPSKCGTYVTAVNVKTPTEATTFRNNIQLNNYLHIQFIFDKFADYKLYTYGHLTLINKQAEYYG